MEPFIGQIALFAFNFVPKDWAACDGTLLSIAENIALFSILGTTYGGNGTTTFALPDLRGRGPVGQGNYYGDNLGETGGAESTTLTTAQLPRHAHALGANSAAASSTSPADACLADTYLAYGAMDGTAVPMAAGTIGTTGASQAVETLAPYLVMNWCICLNGIFPSRN